jgi:acyl-CoA thioesterase FadM
VTALGDLHAFPLVLPRNAFSPREQARAGDLWRACQDAAVWESMRVGWPPARYREEGTSFIVRTMTARHYRETAYGERLVARTWVSRFRREMFSTREVRIEADGAPVLAATQEWVHVAADLTPTRAPAALTSAFPVVPGIAESVALPEIAARAEGTPSHGLRFRCWHVWMDPLAHVNHPVYVDFVDELLSAVLARAGVAPETLVPVAETATFRAGVTAGAAVRVTARLAGRTPAGDAVIAHEVYARAPRAGAETLCAKLTTVRTTTAGPAPLLEALSGPAVEVGDG